MTQCSKCHKVIEPKEPRIGINSIFPFAVIFCTACGQPVLELLSSLTKPTPEIQVEGL